MNNIINTNTELQITNEQLDVVQLSEQLLNEARTSIENKKAICVPIGELSTLGAGVSSLIPTFHTVTQTSTIATDGIYKIANQGVGDVLKMAKDGNAWGALKDATGKSKMAKLKEVDNLSVVSKSTPVFDPTTMMIAATLYSIEKDLNEIKETQKKIIDFLEIENESSIEADVEALTRIVSNYKYTWNNKLEVVSDHKTVKEIQIRSNKSINAYKKKISKIASSKQLIVSQSKINSIYSVLEKNFKYYRLSLYSFSLASMLEILLSGNLNEGYILKAKNEIKMFSSDYRDLFDKSSIHLEKISHIGLETNVVKGIGSAGEAVGKAIGNIPLLEKSNVDDFLLESGKKLKENASSMENKAVKEFATLNNPGTKVFLNKMEDIAKIYNNTNQICFDKENIYLL